MKIEVTQKDISEAQRWWETVKHHEGGGVAARNWYAHALCYERALKEIDLILRGVK